MSVNTVSGPQQQINMPAVDLRQLIGALVASEGIRTSSDLQVGQRGAGANMTVDISAGTAVIADDHGAGGGFYAWTSSGVINAPIATSDPTNPRIDRVVLQVNDAFLGDANNTIAIVVVKGTATGGASLANLTGAAAVPSSALLLANVLVPATATSIITADIANVASPATGSTQTMAINTQTGATYTLIAADSGKLVEMNNAGANTLTVPTNASVALPVGTTISVAQLGAGLTTIAAAGGVTLRAYGGNLKLAGQYAIASLIKRGTDDWYAAGNLTP